jgi:glutamate dehydrogenase (NADP+)
MAGMAKKLANSAACLFTGKGPGWGGSELRPEATGYGLVYFAQEMLARRAMALDGLRVAISGSGNVAQHAAQKAMQLGARVVTVSDSDGTAWDADGLDAEKLQGLFQLKRERRGRVEEFARQHRLRFLPKLKPWNVPADIALPCATQNELDARDARALAANGVRFVAEGANMPATPEAARIFAQAGVALAPGKAANAGGVGVSGLEMSQDAMRQPWPREEVDRRLRGIMHGIHEACVRHGEGPGGVDYVRGANLAAFSRLAGAILEQGVV